MDWQTPVDIYCERVGTGFWAEPLNALSNLAFIAAALWAAQTARARGVHAPIAWVLIWMAGLIGVGSFLFHTFANAWSEYADTIPIWSFVAVFVLTAMHVIGGMSVRRVLMVAVFVIAAAVATVMLLASGEGSNAATSAADPLNGSGQYAPAVAALVIFSVVAWWRRHPSRPWIWAATVVFLVSLTFRTLDRDICASVPIGTHWLWHLFNGLMIGLLLQMMVRTGRFEKQQA